MKEEAKIFKELDREFADVALPLLLCDQFADFYPYPYLYPDYSVHFMRYNSTNVADEPMVPAVVKDRNLVTVSSPEVPVTRHYAWDNTSVSNSFLSMGVDAKDRVRNLGRGAGIALDKFTAEILCNGTNVMYCPSGKHEVTVRKNLTVKSKLTVKEIQKAVEYLEEMGSPVISCGYVALVHPDVLEQLKKDPKFEPLCKYESDLLPFYGEVGRINTLPAVRVIKNGNMMKLKNGSCPVAGKKSSKTLPVYTTVLLGAHAFGVTELEDNSRENGHNIVRCKQLSKSTACLGWKVQKSAKRLVEQYMIRIESVCSDKKAPLFSSFNGEPIGTEVVHLKKKEKDGESADAFVAINGKGFLIKKGVDVTLGKDFADVLTQSAKTLV